MLIEHAASSWVLLQRDSMSQKVNAVTIKECACKYPYICIIYPERSHNASTCTHTNKILSYQGKDFLWG
jgi:hypothetical protein